MNTMKDIKDYLHLYVGCTLRCDTGFVILMSVIPEIIPHTSFGIAVINGSESYRTNLGDYRPVLRPLSDITEDEKRECLMLTIGVDEIDRYNWDDFGSSLSPEQFTYLLKQDFDLFSLIPKELAIDKTTI